MSEGEPLDQALAAVYGELQPSARSWLQEIASGTLRWRGRLDHVIDSIALKKKPTEYLKQIWFDSLVFTPEAIRHLQAVAGPDQIVMGSDWPYPWVYDPVDHIMASDSLDDAQKRGVLGETAAKLLNIPA